MVDQQLRIEVSAHRDALPVARAALSAWLGVTHVPPDVGQDVLLASWETMANAVEHPLQGGDTIEIVARLATDFVAVSVTNDGHWGGQRPTARPEGGGLGLVILGRTMHRVQIRRSAGRTTVSMCRRLARGEADGDGRGRRRATTQDPRPG